MQYEVKDITYGQAKEKGDGTVDQNATVMSGIVGDTYGFNKWNDISINYPLSHTGQQIKDQMTAAAVAMVQDKYPNT